VGWGEYSTGRPGIRYDKRSKTFRSSSVPAAEPSQAGEFIFLKKLISRLYGHFCQVGPYFPRHDGPGPASFFDLVYIDFIRTAVVDDKIRMGDKQL
jgi:hypothetical protein